MKLDRDKYMLPEERKSLLLAVRSRVKVSDGGDGPVRRKGAPHPNSPRDFAMLAFDAVTGIRVSELTGIRWGDLRGVWGDTKEERPGKARVRRSKKRDPRTGGPVYEEVAFPEIARRALSDYFSKLPVGSKESHCRVFPVTSRTAERVFKYYARRAGLNSRLSIHSLRHTHAIEVYRQFRDLKLVQDALGHADIKTTQGYMHAVEMDDKLSKMDIDLTEDKDAHARPVLGSHAGPSAHDVLGPGEGASS